ncbi:MAG: rhomboid family intramembrane serine protease, partial [Verrucomicrobiales bacterium]
NSVGVSGGVAGLLGFLLVFETLHRELVPKNARRRLLATLGLMILIGGLGVRFIDNAAHAGGLLGGMLYAFVVFPKSSSPLRPKPLTRDRVVGSVCGLILLYAGGLAVLKMAAP